MPYTYHLKDDNNDNTFLTLTLNFSQFQGNSDIIQFKLLSSLKLLKIPGLPV